MPHSLHPILEFAGEDQFASLKLRTFIRSWTLSTRMQTANKTQDPSTPVSRAGENAREPSSALRMTGVRWAAIRPYCPADPDSAPLYILESGRRVFLEQEGYASNGLKLDKFTAYSLLFTVLLRTTDCCAFLQDIDNDAVERNYPLFVWPISEKFTVEFTVPCASGIAPALDARAFRS